MFFCRNKKKNIEKSHLLKQLCLFFLEIQLKLKCRFFIFFSLFIIIISYLTTVQGRINNKNSSVSVSLLIDIGCKTWPVIKRLAHHLNWNTEF